MGNLTSVNGYRLEHETPQHFYYYTPCRNGEQCPQGNANFYGNAVQFQPGANQCQHYLSVDHHDHPDYFFGTAAWIFRYEDGEMCDSTQQPRRTNVYMLCDEFMSGGAYLYDAEEPQKCNYALSVRTPLACVPENSHHAKCQWKYACPNNQHYTHHEGFDMSTLRKGKEWLVDAGKNMMVGKAKKLLERILP